MSTSTLFIIQALISEIVGRGHAFEKHSSERVYTKDNNSKFINTYNHKSYGSSLEIHSKNDLIDHLKNKFFLSDNTEAFVSNKKEFIAYNKKQNLILILNPEIRDLGTTFRPSNNKPYSKFDKLYKQSIKYGHNTKIHSGSRPVSGLLKKYIKLIDQSDRFKKSFTYLINKYNLDCKSFPIRPFEKVDSKALIRPYKGPNLISEYESYLPNWRIAKTLKNKELTLTNCKNKPSVLGVWHAHTSPQKSNFKSAFLENAPDTNDFEDGNENQNDIEDMFRDYEDYENS